jgi:hypothetical protein
MLVKERVRTIKFVRARSFFMPLIRQGWDDPLNHAPDATQYNQQFLTFRLESLRKKLIADNIGVENQAVILERYEQSLLEVDDPHQAKIAIAPLMTQAYLDRDIQSVREHLVTQGLRLSAINSALAELPSTVTAVTEPVFVRLQQRAQELNQVKTPLYQKLAAKGFYR